MRRLPLVVLYCVALARIAAAGILFTDEPIVRFSPAIGVAVDDLFGYSTVLHRTENSGDFDQIILKSRQAYRLRRGIKEKDLCVKISSKRAFFDRWGAGGMR